MAKRSFLVLGLAQARDFRAPVVEYLLLTGAEKSRQARACFITHLVACPIACHIRVTRLAR